MYHPNLGRWMTMDPIGYTGGDVNLFRANSNNAVNHLDPQGLSDKKGPGKGNGKISDVEKDLKDNHSEHRYWVCIFSDGPKVNPDGDAIAVATGHVWIGVFDLTEGTSVVRGLHPTEPVNSRNPEVPGELRDDSKRPFTVARCFPITGKTQDKIYKAWIDRIAREERRPPRYNTRSNNCTTFATNLVAGIAPKVTDMPVTSVNFGVDENAPTSVRCPSHLSCFLVDNDCGVKGSVCYDKSK